MALTKGGHDAVVALLAGAAKAIANVRYCWLATEADDGSANPRPMGRLPPDPGEDGWTVRFVVDGRSDKVAEMRRSARVAIILQNALDDAFVTLTGNAVLLESAAEVGARWNAAYDAYFPTAADRANTMFVEVDAERIKLWIRGVTPEPFGLRATILERGPGRAWRIAPDRDEAARGA